MHFGHSCPHLLHFRIFNIISLSSSRSLSEFVSLAKGKVTARCRKCLLEYSLNWRKKNPEKYKKRRQKYRDANRDRIKEQDRNRYALNRKKENERGRRYKETHREKVNQKASEWRKNNRDRINKRVRAWRKFHLKEMREKDGIRRSSPREKLHRAVSSGVRQSLKDGSKSRQRWEILVGYTLDELNKHLERQFDNKMTWDNYGSYWHIDHIIPVSAHNFKCSDDFDFKRAWDLKNLRPLEARENLRKRATLSEPFQPSLL